MNFKPSESLEGYICKHITRCGLLTGGGLMCVICLEPCDLKDRKCFITHCRHHYHDTCLLEHFKEHNFCPNDRRILFREDSDGQDIFLQNDEIELFAILPDVVAQLQPFEYIIQGLLKKEQVFDDVQIANQLRRAIPRIIKNYNWWLGFKFGLNYTGRWKQALSFSDQAISYYVTAQFIDQIKSRLSLKLWLKLEKMRHRRLEALWDLKCSDNYDDESEEDWFLNAAMPQHSFAKHIAHVFGRLDTASVTQIEVSVQYADGGKRSTSINVANPGEALDLQFGNGKDGLRIQLLHGQILKITDWRAVGTLSKIDIDYNREDGELFLKDPSGNNHAFIFRFD